MEIDAYSKRYCELCTRLFYNYIYLDEEGIPYYVGKGCEDRAFEQHYQGERSIPLPSESDRVLIKFCQSEGEAFSVELFFISFYGRKDLSTGSLWNLTNGGQGCSSRICLENVRKKISKTLSGRPRPPHIGILTSMRFKNKKLNLTQQQTEARRQRMLGENNPMAHMSSPMLGKQHKQEAKDKISNRAANRWASYTPEKSSEIMKKAATTRKNNPNNKPVRWITNGIENKQLAISEETPQGWKDGMKPKKLWKTKNS